MCNYKQCVKACCAGPVDKQKTILSFLRSNSHQKTNSTRLLSPVPWKTLFPRTLIS